MALDSSELIVLDVGVILDTSATHSENLFFSTFFDAFPTILNSGGMGILDRYPHTLVRGDYSEYTFGIILDAFSIY